MKDPLEENSRVVV